MRSEQRLRPLPLGTSIVLFGVPCLLFLVAQRVVAPRMVDAGIPHAVTFLVLASPFALLIAAALVGYRMEGRTWSRSEMAERFRFRRMTRRTWLWALAAAAGNVATYLLVYVAARPLLRRIYDAFPDPDAIGEIFGDATTFLGVPMAGNVWLLGVFFVFYVLNVMGEEIWWRGYIFPRQELRHGRATWWIHGLLWTAFHLFAPYNTLMVLPGALWVSWIVQREKNTWVFVISHATLNGLAMIRIVSGVFG